MKGILLSIKPKWAEAILSGDKEFEYRKTAPSMDAPYNALLYASSPVQKIVGIAHIDFTLTESVDQLINQTVLRTPHDSDEIRDYFGNVEDGTALHIKEYKRFDNPIDLGDVHPPMNFSYVDITKFTDIPWDKEG